MIYIKKRIALIILNIKSIDINLVGQSDIEFIYADTCLKLLRSEVSGFVRHKVLHRRDIQQQRERYGQHYQQQKRC